MTTTRQLLAYLRPYKATPAADTQKHESTRFIDAPAKAIPLEFVLTMLLLRGGLKRSELVSLELTDIDITNPASPRIRVNPPNRLRQRGLSLPLEFADAYQKYLTQYNLVGGKTRVFNYTEPAINNILKRIASRAGINGKPVSCEILRDTFAVLLLRSGKDAGRFE